MYVLGAASCQQIHQSQMQHSVLSVVCVQKEIVHNLPNLKYFKPTNFILPMNLERKIKSNKRQGKAQDKRVVVLWLVM